MKYLIYFLLLFIMSSCYQGEDADLIIHNAKIHVDLNSNSTQSAMAIKNGRIVEIGPERQILNKYKSNKKIDARGKHVYPGLIDAHAHMISYAEQLNSASLFYSRSKEEILSKCSEYNKKNMYGFIIGRGWDQTLWSEDEMPKNNFLNKEFPNIPVCLYRIDGHAVLVNDFLLNKAGIDASTKVVGGEIVLSEDKPTGLLLDNAIELVKPFLPNFPKSKNIESFKLIENELLKYGVTGIHEAGMNFKDIQIFKNLIDKHGFKLNIYGMLYPTEENFKFVEDNGVYSYKNLMIRSFKAIADGALGSHGALLKKAYNDYNGNGIAVTSKKELLEIAVFCLKNDYQMNTHCIGDSANSVLLNLIEKVNNENKNHRFRIEHAQVVDPQELVKFKEFNVIPSVQPTHATSDMRWAENRIGKQRMIGAYAYKSLLKNAGMIVLGTDFPVEKTNPFLTIHSSVQRKNEHNDPVEGFHREEGLSLQETIKGMTYWPAYASFDEKNRGTLEKGKIADFVIMKKEILSSKSFKNNGAWKTFISGEEVYSSQ